MRKLLLAVVLAAGCGGGEDPPGTSTDPVAPSPRLSDIQQRIFTPSCAAFTACHDSNAPAGQLDLTAGNAHGSLVNRPAAANASKVLVVPGDPDASFLMQKLRGTQGSGEGDRMPLRNPPLGAAQLDAIDEWIATGAAND